GQRIGHASRCTGWNGGSAAPVSRLAWTRGRHACFEGRCVAVGDRRVCIANRRARVRGRLAGIAGCPALVGGAASPTGRRPSGPAGGARTPTHVVRGFGEAAPEVPSVARRFEGV